MKRIEHNAYPHNAGYGEKPFWQHEAAAEALLKITERANEELRGKTITLTVSEDGVTVVATLEATEKDPS